MRFGLKLAIAGAVVAAMAGCGDDGDSDQPEGSPLLTEDGEVLIECTGSDDTFAASEADGQDCKMQPAIGDDLAWLNIAQASGVAPESTMLGVQLRPTVCSAESPQIQAPYLDWSDDAVTIYMTSAMPEAESDCPESGTLVSGTIDLGQELGEREVLDGSVYPPVSLGSAAATG